jgi:hypothetical protein
MEALGWSAFASAKNKQEVRDQATEQKQRSRSMRRLKLTVRKCRPTILWITKESAIGAQDKKHLLSPVAAPLCVGRLCSFFARAQSQA